MANNLSGISYTNNFNNLDGLSIVQADELFIDGTSIDPTNLVPYTGASQTIDLNNQNIKTTRLPTANADLTNKLYVDSAVSTGSGDTLGIVNLNFVRYSGSISDTDLGTYKISSSAVPTTANHLTNKTYVDGAITTATSNKVPYTGGTANVVLTGTNKFQQSYNATVSDTTTVVNRQTLDSAIAGLGAGILNLNNTWGYGNTNDMNGAFASIQPQIANQTNLATGGTDFIGTMPICVLTKPSTYYNLSGAGALGMSVGLDLGYTGGSFTAGASTTITGSWTANTVSNRIATITFDVAGHIGKSLNCVWEGVTPLVFATSPPPFFTVVNGSTTVYSSPQPISGTNTYAWNFTPTVGLTTITYTVQSTGTPSLPAFSWTRFSIKQIGASYLAYKPGAKYTATFTNLLGSQNMSFYVYQYNAAGGSGVPIGDIFAIPITTSGQTITITFTPNSGGNTGTIIFFFQPSTANQYVRFDTATLKRADMTIAGNIQSAVTVNSQIISANPTGNSGNGTVINMNAFNGAFGSIEAFNNANTTKLPLALNAYGGNVGIGKTNPVSLLDVAGAITASGQVNLSSITTGDAGLCSELTNILNLNLNFRGTTTTTAERGVALRLDGRPGVQPFQFIYRPAGSTAESLVACIDTNGNFGIGTPAPADKLTVQTAPGNYGMVHTDGTASVGTWVNASNNGGWFGTKSNHNLQFFTNNGGSRMTIDTAGRVGINNTAPTYTLDVAGTQRINSGDNTFTAYAPTGGTWNATMHVGSGTNRGTAQVFATNGNLHMDAQPGYDMYYGYYPYAAGNNNRHLIYGNMFLGTAPAYISGGGTALAYSNTGGQIMRSNVVQRMAWYSNSQAWSSGVNAVYAFYKSVASEPVRLTGRFSHYVGGPGMSYPYIRVYSQSAGVYSYYSLQCFFNVTYNHTPQSIDLILQYSDIPYTGWFDVYFYNNGGCITDGNDYLWINAVNLIATAY